MWCLCQITLQSLGSVGWLIHWLMFDVQWMDGLIDVWCAMDGLIDWLIDRLIHVINRSICYHWINQLIKSIQFKSFQIKSSSSVLIGFHLIQTKSSSVLIGFDLIWFEMRREEMRWDEMIWDEMIWFEMRRDDMRWDVISINLPMFS
jgi:hypothetical protein